MRRLVRYILVFMGFVPMSLGLALMLRSGLGMGPWGAFEQGLVRMTGITFGRAAQLVGLVLIVLAWMMRIRPTLVTVLNMVFIGVFSDWFLARIPAPNDPLLQAAALVLGLVVYSAGVGEYLWVNLGAGPREAVMLGLSRVAGWSIRAARVTIDLTVLVLAWFMKGPIGVGTVTFALLSGPLIQFFLRWMQAAWGADGVPAIRRSIRQARQERS
ncbi:MAG: hypothetical protein NUW23_02640 [Firmicutes bacterium]|jgi:uncharacterized membrane protein YczE|nr:hypothetical protein [Bacillota bacterium]